MTSTVGAVAEVKQPEVAEKAEMQMSGSKTWFWFVIIWLIYLLDMADRSILSAVTPVLKPLWNLSDTEIAFIGVPASIVMAIAVIPMGALVDKWSRKYMITIMVTIWSAASWARSWARGVVDITVAGTFLFLGEAGYNPAGYALLGAWFPQKQRGRVIGLFNMAQALGAFGGLAVAGYILANFGWQHIFGVFAIPGFVLGLIMIFAPDYKAKKVDAKPEAEKVAASGQAVKSEPSAQVVKVSYKEVLRYIAASPTLLKLYVFQIAVYIWASCFGGWVVFYFIRYFKADVPTAAGLAGIIGLFACFGAPVIGILNDALTRRFVNGRILTGLISVVGYTVFWTISILTGMVQGPMAVAVIFWALGNFCMAGQWGTVITAVMDLMPAPYRATGQSFIPVGQYLTVAVAGLTIGVISDQLGLINALMLMLYVSFVPCVLLLWSSARSYARDLARCKALGTFELEKG